MEDGPASRAGARRAQPHRSEQRQREATRPARRSAPFSSGLPSCGPAKEGQATAGVRHRSYDARSHHSAMLTLLLTPTDGGTGWRHALASGEARAGWECTGPLGLAQRIGRILGYHPRLATPPERVAAFAERLARLDD